MKTFDGRGGRSAKRHWSVGALGLSLAFVVGVFSLSADASGGIFGGGFIPIPPSDGPGSGAGGGSEPPPKSEQECFDEFLHNQDRCKELWCEPASFIWITWTSCMSRFLDTCIDGAKQAYECCLNGGPPCEGN